MSKFHTYTLQEIQLIQDCVTCEIDEQDAFVSDITGYNLKHESSQNAKDILFHTNQAEMLTAGLKQVESQQPLTVIQRNDFIELLTSWLIYYTINPCCDINNPNLATALEKMYSNSPSF